MQTEFRKLNDDGMARFSEWLASGADGIAPVHLLADPQTSAAVAHTIRTASNRIFGDRYEFGQYLSQLLAPFDPAVISQDRGLWTALAIVWFDQLCPAGANGERKVEKEYRYILSRDYRHYYRHLVRSPWQLVRNHGEVSKFLLLAPTAGNIRSAGTARFWNSSAAASLCLEAGQLSRKRADCIPTSQPAGP